MGRTAFTPDNVNETDENFKKFKLERGEVSRVVCLEEPWSEYVHNLQAPKLDSKGLPVQVMKKRFDGSEYMAYEMDFFGNPICLGDDGILLEKGKDPKNCPACAAAENSDSVQAPKRRHAMHIIRYTTKQNGQLMDPFSVQVVMWCFTDNIFTQLVTIATNNKGGLPRHDLIMGPPEEPIMFQKFKIVTSDEAAWLMGGEDRKKFVIDSLKNNRAVEPNAQGLLDLGDPFCGKKKNREWVSDALMKVKARWNVVNGVVSVANPLDMSSSADTQSLSEGLDELLSGASSPAMSQAVNPDISAVDSTMADLLAEPETVSGPGSSGEKIDGFEDLLGSLGN